MGSAFSDFEHAGWADKAATYDRLLGRVTARMVDHLLDAAGVGAGTRVLDVACGPGDAAAAAAARAGVPVGIDIAPSMVHLARRRHPGLDFRLGSAEELPVAAGSMDAVVGNFLVHHLAEPEAVVRGFTKVLVPGGRLALTAWDQPDRARLVGVLIDAIAAVGAPPPSDLPSGPPFFRFSADDTFGALLAGAGFTDVEVRTVAFAYPVAAPADLWDGLIGGTVRTSALVLGQPDEMRARIRAEFDRQMARYADGHRFAVPVSVKQAVGRRP
jgi:SAM-dependent methyltransferase